LIMLCSSGAFAREMNESSLFVVKEEPGKCRHPQVSERLKT
jgi:hypothetical protein